MRTTIQKWGNSQGLRLSRELLGQARIAVGDPVEVTLRGGVLLIAPIKLPRKRHSLQELVGRIPDDYRTEETEWGAPAGAEAW